MQGLLAFGDGRGSGVDTDINLSMREPRVIVWEHEFDNGSLSTLTDRTLPLPGPRPAGRPSLAEFSGLPG